jgi:hypothetical protein
MVYITQHNDTQHNDTQHKFHHAECGCAIFICWQFLVIQIYVYGQFNFFYANQS